MHGYSRRFLLSRFSPSTQLYIFTVALATKLPPMISNSSMFTYLIFEATSLACTACELQIIYHTSCGDSYLIRSGALTRSTQTHLDDPWYIVKLWSLVVSCSLDLYTWSLCKLSRWAGKKRSASLVYHTRNPFMTAFLQNKGVELGLVDMSTVFLHVGQCGNQLGQSFWQEVGEWCSPPGVRSLPSTTLKLPYKSGSHKTPSWSSPTHSCTPVAYSLLDGTLPCVLVDSETKVVRKYTGDRMLLGRKVPVEFRVTERGGRGNNWAYGYSSARVENQRVVRETKFGQDENNMVGRVQQCVRKLVEKCDRFGGFIQLHSIAGGTGSGAVFCI